MSMSDYEAIQTLFEQTYADRVRGRDIEAYIAMYTADAFWSPPNAADCRGQAEIAEGFARQIANADIDPVFTAEEIRLFGATAYVLGNSVAQITDHGTGSVRVAKYMALWIVECGSDNGEWLISRQLWNNKP
jgi:ketosteroid isomerase-like protein